MIEIRVPSPVETVTPIKPSEALRLGRLIRPVQGETHCFSGSTAACAVGAMALGYGWNDPGTVDEEDYPASQDKPVYAFVAEHSGLSLADAAHPGGTPLYAVWSRNDDAISAGRDPDAAVLAYLAERGL